MKYKWEKNEQQDFPGGPVAKTQCFYCCGPRFSPWWGNLRAHKLHSETHRKKKVEWTVTTDLGDTGDLKDRNCVVVVILCQGLRGSSIYASAYASQRDKPSNTWGRLGISSDMIHINGRSLPCRAFPCGFIILYGLLEKACDSSPALWIFVKGSPNNPRFGRAHL